MLQSLNYNVSISQSYYFTIYDHDQARSRTVQLYYSNNVPYITDTYVQKRVIINSILNAIVHDSVLINNIHDTVYIVFEAEKSSVAEIFDGSY